MVESNKAITEEWQTRPVLTTFNEKKYINQFKKEGKNEQEHKINKLTNTAISNVTCGL